MLISNSFTITSNGGRLHVLQTQCHVAQAFDPTAPQPHPALHPFKAIWDTGATNSVITEAVVSACGLAPVGITQVHGVNSTSLSETYLVNILLPNATGVPNVKVTKGTLGGGSDVLIGMDIITLGDFAITNLNGKTVFSFCMPSHRSLDFVIEHKARQQRELLAQQQQQRAHSHPHKRKRPPKNFGKNKHRR